MAAVRHVWVVKMYVFLILYFVYSSNTLAIISERRKGSRQIYGARGGYGYFIGRALASGLSPRVQPILVGPGSLPAIIRLKRLPCWPHQYNLVAILVARSAGSTHTRLLQLLSTTFTSLCYLKGVQKRVTLRNRRYRLGLFSHIPKLKSENHC